MAFFGLRLARADESASDLRADDFQDVAIVRPDGSVPAPEPLAQIATADAR